MSPPQYSWGKSEIVDRLGRLSRIYYMVLSGGRALDIYSDTLNLICASRILWNHFKML